MLELGVRDKTAVFGPSRDGFCPISCGFPTIFHGFTVYNGFRSCTSCVFIGFREVSMPKAGAEELQTAGDTESG